MNRQLKRELLAKIISALIVALPLGLAIVIAIIVYTLLGWEGRAGAIVGVGGIFTIAALAVVLPTWSRYADSGSYLHLKGTSLLRDWIEEPEEIKPSKKEPKAGAWKE
jgi:hypothetical protein